MMILGMFIFKKRNKFSDFLAAVLKSKRKYIQNSEEKPFPSKNSIPSQTTQT